MHKAKNTLIAVIVIVVIGTGFYFVFTSQNADQSFGVPQTERAEAIPYEIVSVGIWQEEIRWARYHIVVGELLIEEEQVKTLAERIITDITIEDSNLEEVELFFYHDGSVACQPEAADAYVRWVALSVKIREGDIDLLDQSTWSEWWKNEK